MQFFLPITQQSTINESTTFLSSTSFTTVSPVVCLYQVPNCHLCPQNAPLFDLTQGNVSCIFFQNEWRWTFTPNNGTITNTGEIVLSGNTTTLVQGNFENNASLNISSGSALVVSGNFTQTSQAQIVFTFNSQHQQQILHWMLEDVFQSTEM